MSSSLKTLLIIVLFVGSVAGTYTATKHYTYKDAYAKGQEAGQTGQKVLNELEGSQSAQQTQDLQSRYNTLEKQYNDLVNRIKAYNASVSSSNRPAPFTCTTNMIGETAFTTCR